MNHGELETYFLTDEGTPEQEETTAWLRQHDVQIYRSSKAP
jgi:hypothetical protein